MLDVIPMLITENEFRFFEEKDFKALENVLDDIIAEYLANYLENPKADPAVRSTLERYLGDVIRSFTLHITLRNRGILKLLATIAPETLLQSNLDLNEVYTQLKFLEDNLPKLRATIPNRTMSDYSSWITTLHAVSARMQAAGVPLHYSDMFERMKSNQFLFYKSNDKGHSTYCNIVTTRRNQWEMCLRGIEFVRHCNANGVAIDRRLCF